MITTTTTTRILHDREQLEDFASLLAQYRRLKRQLDYFLESPDFRLEPTAVGGGDNEYMAVGTPSYENRLAELRERLWRVHIDPDVVQEEMPEGAKNRERYIAWARDREANTTQEDRRLYWEARKHYEMAQAELRRYNETLRKVARVKAQLLAHPWLEARARAENEPQRYAVLQCNWKRTDAIALPSIFKEQYIEQ